MVFDVTFVTADMRIPSRTAYPIKNKRLELGTPTARFLSLQRSDAMSSYGQHAPSSSFQQDSALVAQYASHVYSERDPRPYPHSDVPEEIAAWNDSTLHESRPKRLTIGLPVRRPDSPGLSHERSPLLRKPSVSRINESYESVDGRSSHDFDYKRTFLDEINTLAKYTLPVFG
jgi:hypothetical protein